MSKYLVKLDLSISDGKGNLIKRFSLPFNNYSFDLTNDIPPLNKFLKLTGTAEKSQFGTDKFYCGFIFAESEKSGYAYRLSNADPISDYSYGNLYFHAELLIYKDGILINDKESFLKYEELDEFIKSVKDYNYKVMLKQVFELLVVNPKYRDIARARKIYEDCSGFYVEYYTYKTYVFELLNLSDSSCLYDLVQIAKNAFYYSYHTGIELSIQKEVDEDKRKVVELFNTKIEENQKKLMLAKISNQIDDDLFIIYDDKNKIPTCEHAHSLLDGRPYFGLLKSVIFIKQIREEIKINAESIKDLLDKDKTNEENYLKLKKEFDDGLFDKVGSADAPDYNFEGLTREQIDAKAWNNYCIENHLINTVSLKRKVGDFLDSVEKEIKFKELLKNTSSSPYALSANSLKYYIVGHMHNPDALYLMGVYRFYGMNGEQQNTEYGLSYLYTAADENSIEACLELYKIFSNKQSNLYREKEAEEYLKKAKELGYQKE